MDKLGVCNGMKFRGDYHISNYILTDHSLTVLFPALFCSVQDLSMFKSSVTDG